MFAQVEPTQNRLHCLKPRKAMMEETRLEPGWSVDSAAAEAGGELAFVCWQAAEGRPSISFSRSVLEQIEPI